MGDLGGEDFSDDRSKDLCVHGSPLREREPEISCPPSPLMGEGLGDEGDLTSCTRLNKVRIGTG